MALIDPATSLPAEPVVDLSDPTPGARTDGGRLLDPGFNLTLRPMQYPQFFDMYKDAVKNTWTVEEIDFSDDLVDLNRKLVPAERLGTALGLMFVVQNAGVAGANLVAGWLNDGAGASAANPAGYLPMMWFFGLTSAAGFVFAVLLWRVAGRAHHEAVTHGA